jgi:hypothetical protein
MLAGMSRREVGSQASFETSYQCETASLRKGSFSTVRRVASSSIFSNLALPRVWLSPCNSFCVPSRLHAAFRTETGQRLTARRCLNRGPEVFSEATAPARSVEEGSVAQLAKFFPAASPLRLPARLTRNHGAEALAENVVIEYGTAREVLFACNQPLEFADKLHLKNSDGTFDVEVSVVAVRYHNGRTAVAARFTHKVSNWIVKP